MEACAEEADAAITNPRDARTKNEFYIDDLGPVAAVDIELPAAIALVNVGVVSAVVDRLVRSIHVITLRTKPHLLQCNNHHQLLPPSFINIPFKYSF